MLAEEQGYLPRHKHVCRCMVMLAEVQACLPKYSDAAGRGTRMLAEVQACLHSCRSTCQGIGMLADVQAYIVTHVSTQLSPYSRCTQLSPILILLREVFGSVALSIHSQTFRCFDLVSSACRCHMRPRAGSLREEYCSNADFTIETEVHAIRINFAKTGLYRHLLCTDRVLAGPKEAGLFGRPRPLRTAAPSLQTRSRS